MVLPLLLVMTTLLFLGLMYAQIGSAADQRTQTQTAADAASVSAAHQLRDFTIGSSARQLPYSFGVQLQAVVLPSPALRPPACSAAVQNWAGNPHHSPLDCNSALGVAALGDRVRAEVNGPAGEVVDGPADVQAQRSRTSSIARVVLDHCPAGLGNGYRQAIADRIADEVVLELGVSGARSCFAGEESVLGELEELYEDPYTTAEAIALIGEPNSIAGAVRQGFRIEIVE